MHLVVKDSKGTERRIEVAGDTAVLGRAAHCDLVVDRPYVSKQHVKVLCGVVAVDLESSNGTFVDGEPVQGPVLLPRRRPRQDRAGG